MEPAASSRVELRVVGAGMVETHYLAPGRDLVIGRARTADVPVDDRLASRQHAVLRTGPPVTIEDLGSANGTRVGDRLLRAGEPVSLTPGEVVQIGGLLLILQGGLPERPSSPGRADASVGRAASSRPPPPRDPLPTLLDDEAPATRVGALVEPPSRAGGAGGAGGAGCAGGTGPVVRAPAMMALYALVDRVAASPLSVLLLGETGVGKEVTAEAIHNRSQRAQRPFLRLNCAALSESLLESELFGHEKGAFTGAAQTKPGLLETAEGGTVFLDEVGELPLSTQVKLLRVLEERQVLRVGGLKPRPIEVRFVAATNRDLTLEVERGTFRRDLYFRLNGISLMIPPLRERVGEIPELSRLFLSMTADRLGRPAPRLRHDALALLERHTWPGNVRELRNVVERAAVLCAGSEITPEHLLLDVASASPPPPSVSPGRPAATAAPAAGVPGRPSSSPSTADDAPPATLRGSLEPLERQRILDVLERCGGNQTQAARQLGISRGTLLSRLDAYGVPRPRKPSS
ncbi:uncharacterized protein CMC5_083940 [Chondromyces crocatus]|uniref:Fis family transcriptional regulator n=2 Tax=Chondromyces crocatus TaxID=52 RepID=A0A0K1ETP1_CHOCO|nr:uncharacterized protein CMC5_083940 [Chondromyces crocatus]